MARGDFLSHRSKFFGTLRYSRAPRVGLFFYYYYYLRACISNRSPFPDDFRLRVSAIARAANSIVIMRARDLADFHIIYERNSQVSAKEIQ